MSPRASVATVVMPMRTGVTESSTHSCSAVYLRSVRMVATAAPRIGCSGTTVERALDDGERFARATHVRLHLGADVGDGEIDDGERDRVPEGRAGQPGRHDADLPALVEDGAARPGGAAPRAGEADEHPPPRLTGLVRGADALERRAPDEVGGLASQAHHPAQPGGERVDVEAELVAVQRHRGLEPQRVAGREP